MGLDIFLYDGKKEVNVKSDKYPEHYFHKGYLRSAYNDTGFNLFVNGLIGKDFYTIFEPVEPNDFSEDIKDKWTDDEWFDYLHPVYPKEHLEGALLRVKEVIEELKTLPNYAIKTIDVYKDTPEMTKAEALKWIVEREKEKGTYNYEVRVPGNGSGTAWVGFHSPMKVVALIPATGASELEIGEIGNLFAKVHGLDLSTRSVHVVYEVEGLMDFYIAQAEICQEFIEYALTLKEPRIGGFPY